MDVGIQVVHMNTIATRQYEPIGTAHWDSSPDINLTTHCTNNKQLIVFMEYSSRAPFVEPGTQYN